MTEINITPLVDVVLVLLILMMVTATAIASRTMVVEVPKARSGEPRSPARPLVIEVDADGALLLEAMRVDDAAVRARVRRAASEDASTPVVVAADGRARHEAVVRALDILKGERVSKIAILVRPEVSR